LGWHTARVLEGTCTPFRYYGKTTGEAILTSIFNQGLFVDQTRDLVYFNFGRNLLYYNISTGNITDLGSVSFDYNIGSLTMDEPANIMYVLSGDGVLECNLTSIPVSCQVLFSPDQFELVFGIVFSGGKLYTLEQTQSFDNSTIRSADAVANATFTTYLKIPLVPTDGANRADVTDMISTSEYIYFSCFGGCKGVANRVPFTPGGVSSDQIEGMALDDLAMSISFGEKTTDNCAPPPDKTNTEGTSKSPATRLGSTFSTVVGLVITHALFNF